MTEQKKKKPKVHSILCAREFLCSYFPRGSVYIDILKAAVVPDEIQESINSLNRLNVAVVGQRTVPVAFARLYKDHYDDTDEHGNQGGHHVVDDGTHAHLPRGSAV